VKEPALVPAADTWPGYHGDYMVRRYNCYCSSRNAIKLNVHSMLAYLETLK